MADRVLSKNVEGMKFMQRKREAELRAKLQEEQAREIRESHWVVTGNDDLETVASSGISEVFTKITTTSGRKSFGKFNTDIEKLNKEISEENKKAMAEWTDKNKPEDQRKPSTQKGNNLKWVKNLQRKGKGGVDGGMDEGTVSAADMADRFLSIMDASKSKPEITSQAANKKSKKQIKKDKKKAQKEESEDERGDEASEKSESSDSDESEKSDKSDKSASSDSESDDSDSSNNSSESEEDAPEQKKTQPPSKPQPKQPTNTNTPNKPVASNKFGGKPPKKSNAQNYSNNNKANNNTNNNTNNKNKNNNNSNNNNNTPKRGAVEANIAALEKQFKKPKV